MKVLTARYQEGRLDVPEGALQEGDTVTLLVPEEPAEGFSVTEEERALLLRAIEQARRGEGVDGWKLLDQLGD
jgi:hypothetical protein